MKITNKPGTALTRSEVIAEKSAHLATNLHKTKSALPEAVLTKSAIHLDDDGFGGALHSAGRRGHDFPRRQTLPRQHRLWRHGGG